MGYDIADYKSIDPRYGTLSDVDLLIGTLKNHGMKLMMDLVVNHTSDQHAWFLESAKSKDSPNRDWYIWKSPKGFDEEGEAVPPNNWSGILGDALSAWTWHEETQEFYLSLHSPEQVDLNWENTEVISAIYDVSSTNRRKLLERAAYIYYPLSTPFFTPHDRPLVEYIANGCAAGHGILAAPWCRRVSHGCHQSDIETPIFPRFTHH